METEQISGNGSRGIGRRRYRRLSTDDLRSDVFFREEAAAPVSAQRRARGLGWFSLGLGLAQLMAPAALARVVIGSDDRRKRGTMRAVGLRKLAAGIGLLARPRPVGWLWTRVVGDVIDVALLGSTLRSRKSNTARVGTAAGAVLGIAALDYFTNRQLSRAVSEEERVAPLTKAVTVNRPAEEVYRFYRNFQNLPRFMSHIQAIDVLDDRRSHWRAQGPGGRALEWDAEIIEDSPGQRIAWRTVGTGALRSSGEMRFRPAPGGRGTEVIWQVKYEPPGGPLGAAAAKLFIKGMEPKMLTDLRRSKQILELGEVVHSDASIAQGKHPARPMGKGGVR